MWKNYDTTDDETDEFYGYVVGYRNGYVIGYHNGTKAYHDSDDSDNSDSDSESESESESEGRREVVDEKLAALIAMFGEEKAKEMMCLSVKIDEEKASRITK